MLSIITPFHNQDPEIFRRTAASVFAGTEHVSWEWVIIMHNTDNCTPEDLYEIVRHSAHVQIYELKNDFHSPSSPRNEGIAKAAGKYLYFLDDDDVCEAHFFQPAIEKMERDGCDILIGKAESIKGENVQFGVPMALLFPETEDGYIVPDDPDIRGRLLYGACAFLGTKLILRELVVGNHIRFDEDITLSEDILFELRCYSRAEKICVMSGLTGYTYIQREDSLLQRMMGEDSFPESVYMEPLDRIVREGLNGGISPSPHLWNMMGMFGVMKTADSDMPQEKKNRLFSEAQKYIPLLDYDFPRLISEKRIRKEYIVEQYLPEDVMRERVGRLIGTHGIKDVSADEALLYKDISLLDEKQQLAFEKGFWRILEDKDPVVRVGALVLRADETMLLLSMDRETAERAGLAALKEDLCNYCDKTDATLKKAAEEAAYGL